MVGQSVREVCFRKATFAEGFAGQRRDVAGDRLRRTAAPLVHFAVASVIPGQNSSPSLIANYSSVMSPRDATRASEILDWYDRHRRSMPWRALPGKRTAPYPVWLSEIMLQQTTVATVGPILPNSFRGGRPLVIWQRPTSTTFYIAGRG